MHTGAHLNGLCVEWLECLHQGDVVPSSASRGDQSFHHRSLTHPKRDPSNTPSVETNLEASVLTSRFTILLSCKQCKQQSAYLDWRRQQLRSFHPLNILDGNRHYLWTVHSQLKTCGAHEKIQLLSIGLKHQYRYHNIHGGLFMLTLQLLHCNILGFIPAQPPAQRTQ